MDAFLQTYVEKGEDPTEYTTICPHHFPEIYGMFVLVHTRPGEEAQPFFQNSMLPGGRLFVSACLPNIPIFPGWRSDPFGKTAANNRAPAGHRFCL